MEWALGVVLILAGPCAACLVGMSDDKLLLHNWDNNIYSVPEHVFESPRLCDVNRGNRYSSLAIFRLRLFTLINSFSGHKWFSVQVRPKLNRWKSTLKPRPKRVSQN